VEPEAFRSRLVWYSPKTGQVVKVVTDKEK
jgi:hypothetical protein